MLTIIPIHDLDAPVLQVYTHLNESQLRHYYEPQPEGLFIAESPAVIERALDAGYEPVSFLMEEKYVVTQGRALLAKCEALHHPMDDDIPVYVSKIDVLSQLTGYHLNRGILGAFRRKPLPTVESICRTAHRVAILDNVENPTNVGAIFRSAAALGMDAVLMTPTSADPMQRRAIRVSVGTVFQIPWTYIGEELTAAHARAMGLPIPKAGQIEKQEENFSKTAQTAQDARKQEMNFSGRAAVESRQQESGSEEQQREPAWPDRGMKTLHQLGFRIVAMALRHDTMTIDDPRLRQADRLAILLGNEGEGLPERTVALCDATIRIPMGHGVDSLNVAAASAVAFWELGVQK